MRLIIRIPFTVLTKSGLAKIIGFENTIKILKLFSFDKSWANYLINRKDSFYYKISKVFFNKLSSGLNIVDLGCGTGNILREYEKSITAIDDSSLNLFFAKYFFAKKSDTLIKWDIEKDIPFLNKSIDFVHLNDTFQFIKNKRALLKEIFRSLKKEGVLLIVHTHKTRLYNSVHGIEIVNLVTILKEIGFKKMTYFSDQLALLKLYLGDSVTSKSELLNSKDRHEAYTILVSKSTYFRKSYNLSTKIKEYVFISPHLDDAILSAGNLITKLRSSGNKVKVVTVFTKASEKPYSLNAQIHLKNSGYTNAIRLFKDRQKEDIKAIKAIGAKYEHLNFTDAAFRRDIDGNFIYDSEMQFSGNVSDKDRDLEKKIKSKLQTIIKSKNIVFMAPLGIGRHVDHCIIRRVVEAINVKSIFWQDYPYVLNNDESRRFFRKNRQFKKIVDIEDKPFSKKSLAISKYKSQSKYLFKSKKIPMINEAFYIK